MATKGYNLEQTGEQVQAALNKAINLGPATEEADGLMTATDKASLEHLNSVIDTKVDKVTGKGLSTNDFTNEDKSKLDTAYQVPSTGIPAADLSSGVQTSLGKANSAVQPADLVPITEKIPAQASAQNQLADKAFVNSSISTASADFKGTYDSLAELQAVTADKNDYGYVVSTDEAGNTVYSRYKYNGSSWVFEYDLNNSSFTAAEWAAIQSGITTPLVQKLGALPTNADLQSALSGKQATLVSGTNIKTVDGQSILGSGNLSVSDPNAVKVTAQTWTDAQKTQARTNIGAYAKPSGGIPKTDLASGVQGSLDLADSAIQARPSGEVDPTITPAEYATQEELAQLEAKVDDLEEETETTIVHSKNIADYASVLSGLYPSSNGTITANANSTSIKFPCKPSTTYTISKVVTNRFRVCYINTEPIASAAGSGVISNNTASEISITTANDSTYIVAYVNDSSAAGSLSIDTILASLQIEEGSPATEYVIPEWSAVDKVARRDVADVKNLAKTLEIGDFGRNFLTLVANPTGSIALSSPLNNNGEYYISFKVTGKATFPIELRKASGASAEIAQTIVASREWTPGDYCIKFICTDPSGIYLRVGGANANIEKIQINSTAKEWRNTTTASASGTGKTIAVINIGGVATEIKESALDSTPTANSTNGVTSGGVKAALDEIGDGKSAYQIAVDNGFVGTEQEWLDSLKGATGPQGIQGPAGPQGNSGYQGAAGELEVVNNCTDGGATKALSAEQGVKLKGENDIANNFNCRPVVPLKFVPEFVATTNITPQDWNCNAKGQIESSLEMKYNEMLREYQPCVKCISQPSSDIVSDDAGLFWTALSRGVDSRKLAFRFAVCFDKEVPEQYRGYFHIYAWSDGYPNSLSHSAHFEVQAQYISTNPNQTRGGWFMGCVNLDQITLGNTVRGVYFNAENVTHVGFRFNHIEENATLWVSQMGFAVPMLKPGVCINIDNFESDIPAMASYAISKGVRLNLSIVADWIQSGQPIYGTLEQARTAAKQGHLIINHTKSHITSVQPAEDIFNGINDAEKWMLANGFARGSRILSNPSNFMNNTRYETYGKSNVHVIIYPWIRPIPLNQNRYVVNYPYYMEGRMFGETFADFNAFSEDAYNKAVGNVNAAMAAGGVAFLNFHETWWEQHWKDFIDEISAIDGITFYTLDDFIEGNFI